MASPEILDQWAREHRALANKPLTRPKDRKNLLRRAEEFETDAAWQRAQKVKAEAQEKERQAKKGRK